MTDQTLSAHTHSDRTEVDPRTVARVVRHATAGLAVVLAILSLISLGLGLAHDTVEAFMVGCTVLVCSAIAGAVMLVTYIAELIMRGQCELRERAQETAEDRQEIRDRLASLEAGERALAGAVRTIADPLDELDERRRGGR